MQTAPVTSEGSRRGRSVFIHPFLALIVAATVAASPAGASLTAGISFMAGPDGEDLVQVSGGSTSPIQNRLIPVIDLALGLQAGPNLELGILAMRTLFAVGSVPVFDHFQYHALEAFINRTFASGVLLGLATGVGFGDGSGAGRDRVGMLELSLGTPVPGVSRLQVIITHAVLFNFRSSGYGAGLRQTNRIGVTARI